MLLWKRFTIPKREHVAHNRQGFALGAVVAAEWIVGKTGIFTMNDVLNIG